MTITSAAAVLNMAVMEDMPGIIYLRYRRPPESLEVFEQEWEHNNALLHSSDRVRPVDREPVIGDVSEFRWVAPQVRRDMKWGYETRGAWEPTRFGAGWPKGEIRLWVSVSSPEDLYFRLHLTGEWHSAEAYTPESCAGLLSAHLGRLWNDAVPFFGSALWKQRHRMVFVYNYAGSSTVGWFDRNHAEGVDASIPSYVYEVDDFGCADLEGTEGVSRTLYRTVGGRRVMQEGDRPCRYISAEEFDRMVKLANQ